MSKPTTIEEALRHFAIKTHEARPGEDETPNFDEALNTIEQVVREQVIGADELEPFSVEPYERMKTHEAAARNMLRGSQRQALKQLLRGES